MKWYCLLASLVPLLAHAGSDEFDLDQIPYFQPKTAQTSAGPAPVQEEQIAAESSKKSTWQSDQDKKRDKDKKEKEKRDKEKREKEKQKNDKPKQQDKRQQDKRKAQTTPKATPHGAKPSQQRPVLKTKPPQIVEAPKPQLQPTPANKPAKSEPQAVKAKTQPVVKVQKRDGSRFSNKYVPAEKKEAVQTPKENPKFARKYALDEES